MVAMDKVAKSGDRIFSENAINLRTTDPQVLVLAVDSACVAFICSEKDGSTRADLG